MEFSHPVKVNPKDDYSLSLVFENGESRVFSVKPYLNHPLFKPLRNLAFFRTAHIDHGTVAWSDDVDLSPDDLYFNSVAE